MTETLPCGGAPAPRSVDEITKDLLAFARPDNRIAWREVLLTAIPFFALFGLMYLSLSLPYIVTFLLAVPTALFLMRLFVIQHDCGHGSFFETRRACDRFGHLLGVVTITPYEDWRLDHALHHAWSGNLDHRGYGDITTWTVKEYREASWLARINYRLFRHPVFLFGLAPLWQFVVRQRWPAPSSKTWPPIRSVIITNFGILCVVLGMVAAIGWWNVFLIQAPIILIATSLGVWLFYVQHQFEDTDWEREPDWNRRHLALSGSSYLKLPEPLMWMTGYIGAHHAHHLSSRVPFYRLPAALEAIPELGEAPALTLGDTLGCVRLALWDEDRAALVSFREAARA